MNGRPMKIDSPHPAPDLAALRIRREPERPRRPVLWILLGAGLVVAAGAGLYIATSPLRPAATVERTTAAVVSEGQALTILTASGYVEAETKADLSPKITSRITDLRVTEGSRVRKGEVIARLDHSDLDAQLAEIAETVFEPREGGRIYDRGVDGSECRWARVLVYEPAVRVVFSWDISPQWVLEDDPDNASEVEVRFEPLSDERTRVVLEHRNLDRHGPMWTAVRDGVDGAEGWPLYLARYAALLESSGRS